MKKWYTSKTVWFNVITGVVGATALFAGVINPQVLSVITGVGNVIIRVFFTDAPIDRTVI